MVKKILSRLRNFWLQPLRSDISRLHGHMILLLRWIEQEYESKEKLNDPMHLERYGYKVYSQNDEDGIIQEIFRRIGTTNKIFVEFGVQNGLESNCHFLLFNGWNGLWIDGDEKMFKKLQEYFSGPLSTKQLTAINAFITVENINMLIGKEGNINGEIDLLSIDIDGNDYWVWEKITCVQPRVVVIECNPKFPPPCEWVMEYNQSHVWDGSDNHGASLKSLELLGSRLGYSLVGTNGINAFFVRSELVNDQFAEPLTAESLYIWSVEKRNRSSGNAPKRYIGNKDLPASVMEMTEAEKTALNKQ